MLSNIAVSRQVQRQQERKINKTARSQEIQEKQLFVQVNCLLRNVFCKNKIQELSNKTGYQVREGKITPLLIVSILMIGCFCDTKSTPIPSLERLCILAKNRFNVVFTKQSLQRKINCKSTVKFMQAVMAEVMSYELDKVLKKLYKENHKLNLKLFSRILLQDSTVISLPETVQRIFKGCGGGASKSAIKLDFIINQKNHAIIRLKLQPGKNPDQSLSNDIINYLAEGDLVLRDLGYFSLSQLANIEKKNALFISRLLKIVKVYLNKDDNNSLDLMRFLEENCKKTKNIDLVVYLGRFERLKVRLIAIKAPREVVELRNQKYKHKHKKDPSQSLFEWFDYTIMVTNIPQDVLSIKMILKLYRIRWQIELVFKNMKSNICIDKLTGVNKYRICCLIVIKVALSWIIMILYAYAQNVVGVKVEVSLDKFTKWLKDEGRLITAFKKGDYSQLLDDIREDVLYLLKENWRRKTSLRDACNTYEKEMGKKIA